MRVSSPANGLQADEVIYINHYERQPSDDVICAEGTEKSLVNILNIRP